MDTHTENHSALYCRSVLLPRYHPPGVYRAVCVISRSNSYAISDQGQRWFRCGIDFLYYVWSAVRISPATVPYPTGQVSVEAIAHTQHCGGTDAGERGGAAHHKRYA